MTERKTPAMVATATTKGRWPLIPRKDSAPMTIKTPATPIHSITRLNSAIARWRSCSMCAILRHLFRYCEMFVWIARWLCDTLSADFRSEEHTYELQSLMRKSYAVFCSQKKNQIQTATKYI